MMIGQETWHESGLGAPGDVDAAQQRVAELAQEGRGTAHPAR